MQQELQALEANHTWDLTTLPPGKKAIGCRWVFKTTLNPNGTTDRYKAHLVAKGFNQVEGIDYFVSFSPVPKPVIVRVLLAIATAHSWSVHQIDINKAFLHGFIDEEVYMLPPEGYSVAQPGQVCLLRHSLYGLKQASRQWNVDLSSKLHGFGFRQSYFDPCLFIKSTDTSFLALLVFVDDVLIAGSLESDILETKTFLHSCFTIKDMGYA